MKVIKIVDTTKKYTDAKGKEHCSVNYYIQLDNKQYVAIRPSFSKGYQYLDAVAEVIKK